MGEFLGLLIGPRAGKCASNEDFSAVNCCKTVEAEALTKMHPKQGIVILLGMCLFLYPCLYPAVNAHLHDNVMPTAVIRSAPNFSALIRHLINLSLP